MFGAGTQYKGILGITQKLLAKQEQEQYRANASVGDPFFKPGAERVKPAQRTDSASYRKQICFFTTAKLIRRLCIRYSRSKNKKYAG